MALKRREFIKGAALTAALACSGPLKGSVMANESINIAGLHDVSGGFDLYGKPIVDLINLAVDEINESGGLLGKQLVFKNFDTQSNMQLYTQYAQQIALREQADVVHGGILSSSREAARPVLNRYKKLYFYNMQYEGGVCDRNIFCTGTTPDQVTKKLVPYGIETYGKKLYIIAADYNYGQIISKWVQHFAEKAGGETIKVEFFPLNVSNFGATIAKIQAAKPDFIYSVLVGSAHVSFYRQWAATGMKNEIPIISSTFGAGNEHTFLKREESEDIVCCYNYFQELDTPVNRKFVQQYRKKYGDKGQYLSELYVSSYQGIKLWAEGVRRAGSTDRMKVIKALERGVSIDAPSGKMTMDGTSHHCSLDVHIAQVRNKAFKILKAYPQQKPTWQSGVCNLSENPTQNLQYGIDI